MRRWLHDAAGGLPATYWYLWTGLLINRVGGFAVLYLSLYLTVARDARPALAGVITGAFGVGGLAGTLAGGALADRLGRRPTLLLSHYGTAAVLTALALTDRLPLIAVLCALLGAGQSMSQPAFVAAIVDVVPEDRRSRAFNLQFWAFNLGLAGASVVAGALATWSYTALFLIDAACTLTTALILTWKVRETATHTERPPGALRTVAKDHIFLTFVGLTLLQSLIYAQTNTIVPLAMHADGLPTTSYGLVTALAGIMIVTGQLFVPKLIDKRRKAHVLAVAMIAMAAGFGSLTWADTTVAYLVAAAVWTLGTMLAAPPNAEINAELAPPAMRARYQSIFFLSFPAAGFLAPAIGGASLEAMGKAHWLATAAIAATTAGLHLLAGKPRERRVARRFAGGGGRRPSP